MGKKKITASSIANQTPREVLAFWEHFNNLCEEVLGIRIWGLAEQGYLQAALGQRPVTRPMPYALRRQCEELFKGFVQLSAAHLLDPRNIGLVGQRSWGEGNKILVQSGVASDEGQADRMVMSPPQQPLHQQGFFSGGQVNPMMLGQLGGGLGGMFGPMGSMVGAGLGYGGGQMFNMFGGQGPGVRETTYPGPTIVDTQRPAEVPVYEERPLPPGNP